MRPPKRILLIDKDEERRGELRFILYCWGYRVLDKPQGEVNAIVTYWPLSNAEAKRLKSRSPHARLVVLVPMADEMPKCDAADVMLWQSRDRRLFIEELRIASAGKRGPKVGFKLAQQGKGGTTSAALEHFLEQKVSAA